MCLSYLLFRSQKIKNTTITVFKLNSHLLTLKKNFKFFAVEFEAAGSIAWEV